VDRHRPPRGFTLERAPPGPGKIVGRAMARRSVAHPHKHLAGVAAGEQPAFVEIGMCNSCSPGQVSVNDVVHVGKARLACDMVGGNAMDAGVEAVEVIARIEQGLKLERDRAAAKADDTDLADAADAGAGGFDVDDYKIECESCSRTTPRRAACAGTSGVASRNIGEHTPRQAKSNALILGSRRTAMAHSRGRAGTSGSPAHTFRS